QARAPAEVRGLGVRTPKGRRAADRVAGLPDVRRTPGGLVDIPVPHQGAPGRRGRAGRVRRTAGLAASTGYRIASHGLHRTRPTPETVSTPAACRPPPLRSRTRPSPPWP